MPASLSARSSICPAGPTNGLPARSSLSPGCSPTSISGACCGPSPNTVCIASFQSGQARQPAASSRRVLRLREAVGIGISPDIVASVIAAVSFNAGRAGRVPPIPLGLLGKNINSGSRLTLLTLLALGTQISDGPNPIRYTERDRWRSPQGLVNAAEIVVADIQ